MDSEKSLAQLEAECKSMKAVLVPPSGRNGKYLKRDYVASLSRHYLTMRYGDSVPLNIQLRMLFDSPQLLYSYFDLKESDRNSIWSDPRVWLTEKIDGVRITLISSREGVSLFSRDISERDYMYIDYSDKVHIQPLSDDIYVVDTEWQLIDKDAIDTLRSWNLTGSRQETLSGLLSLPKEKYVEVTKGKSLEELFRVYVVDVYAYKAAFLSLNLAAQTYKERSGVFKTVVSELKTIGVNACTIPVCKETGLLKSFHEGNMKQGSEGSVIVYIDAPFDVTGKKARAKDVMLKLKTSLFAHLFDSSIMTETVDCFITRIDKSGELITAVALSMFDNKNNVVEVAYTEAIPLSIRKKDIDIHTVVEVSGDKWFEGRIMNAFVESVRYDRVYHSCIQRMI